MPKSNASIVLSSRDATGGRPQNGNLYNQLLFNAENQNIVQGQIQSVAVSEVNFPYDIPNVQVGTDLFGFVSDTVGPHFIVTIPVGFYTGTELAAAMNAETLDAAPPGTVEDDLPQWAYDTDSNRFYVTESVTPSTAIYETPWTTGGDPANGIPGSTLGKDLFTILGFTQTNWPKTAGQFVVGTQAPDNGPPVIYSGSAPLAYTQYIDICSPQLCKFQYFRDGSTTNLARRSDVICRLYISNNVATQEEEGARPFVIHRQFKNARVMRWTADNAVGTIDINLYDDVGQPLTTTWTPRPYQITFNCYEDDKKEGGGSGSGDGSIMEKFANYVARNEAAWASPSYPLSSRR